MRISEADSGDVAGLARLLWVNAHGEEPTRPPDTFAGELARWWADRPGSHLAYVARLDPPELVGMAWVALVPRVPRPGNLGRMSADIQTVFVLPEHRGRGIGSALVDAAAEHAIRLGALHVTVHSGHRAVPVYERLGFASSPQLLQRSPD
ncbi:GNAT family N-acetyltransferase [Microlunatus sp. GCM10028923]|uniref:GNAT family N-acetyltransferase n=1 Tax=Microlunatus sp. GCM10028923 TaxID=3273400 RepID=UPI0036158859